MLLLVIVDMGRFIKSVSPNRQKSVKVGRTIDSYLLLFQSHRLILVFHYRPIKWCFLDIRHLDFVNDELLVQFTLAKIKIEMGGLVYWKCEIIHVQTLSRCYRWHTLRSLLSNYFQLIFFSYSNSIYLFDNVEQACTCSKSTI